MSESDVKPSGGTSNEQEQESAKKALHEFDKGNYDSCLGVLNKLCSGGHSEDPKVMHNKAVAEYLKSKKLKEFTQGLSAVFAKSQVSEESLSGIEDVDQCVMCYNLALLHVHARQPYKALALLEKLIQFVEPLDDNFIKKALFLAVELCLSTQQPERALAMLALIDKPLINGKQSPEKETTASNDASTIRASVYRALSFLLLKSLKPCRRELKSLVNVSVMSLPVTYLKAHFEYLRGNCRKAVKILGSLSSAESVEGYGSIYYNNMAVIHLHMKKPNLSSFYLQNAYEENKKRAAKSNESIADGVAYGLGGSYRNYAILYNLGVSLLHSGKAQPAFDCLIQVLKAFPSNPRLWLRLAECCIMMHKESNDDDRQLGKRLSVIQGSIGSGVHRKVILGTGVSSREKSPVPDSADPRSPLPSLEFASLCLSNALQLLSEDTQALPQSDTEDASSETKLEPRLVQALPSSPMRPTEVQNLRCSVLASSAYVSLCLNNCIMAHKYATELLKQPRLSGAHSYLGHMYQAEALVALDRIADAVQHLNADSITDISCAFPEQNHSADSGDKNGDNQDPSESKAASVLFSWCPVDLQRAKALMLYNLATAHAIRDEQDKALQNLSKSTQMIGLPLPAQMYFLKLYLELMEGRKKTVQNIIRDHFGHITSSQS